MRDLQNEGESGEKSVQQTGFLGDLSDGRKNGDWSSRYDEEAQRHIHWEKRYLIVLLICALTVPLFLGIAFNLVNMPRPFLNSRHYIFSLWGGELGGTLFAMKWLVHSVAKNDWNLDRQIWRILTPHLSASLAFVIVLLINCGIFKLADPNGMSIYKCYGIGFLVGYFSDNAIGKLTELAQVFFGSSLTRK
jgi:hypothetical protein